MLGSAEPILWRSFRFLAAGNFPNTFPENQENGFRHFPKACVIGARFAGGDEYQIDLSIPLVTVRGRPARRGRFSVRGRRGGVPRGVGGGDWERVGITHPTGR